MGIASIYRYSASDNALDPFNLHNQRVIFTPPPEPPPSDHFYATSAELNEWYNRGPGGQGPYRVRHDVTENSPADWQRIDANAESFRLDLTQARWVQPGTGLIAQEDPWPGEGPTNQSAHRNSRYRDAAFKAMLTDDADLKAKVKQELMWQVNEWSTSSLNYARWDPNYPGFWPTPIFNLSRWVQRWHQARDFLGRNYFTGGENDELDRWFYGHANYFTYLYNREAVKRFPGRWSEDWTWAQSNHGWEGVQMWTGGPYAKQPAVGMNNRETSMMTVGIVLGCYLKRYGYTAPTSNPPSYGFYSVDDLVKNGWLATNEYVRGTLFPVGATGDFERRLDILPWLGRSYGVSSMQGITEWPDALARIGDLRAYQLVTDEGYEGTGGSPTLTGHTAGKTVHFLAEMMMRYGDKTYDSRKWNGGILYEPTDVKDTSVARANLYYKSAWLRDAADRIVPNQTGGFPVTPRDGNDWNDWRGEQNANVGMLFQYNRMDHLNVYGG